MKKFLGITIVVLLGIGLLGGCTGPNQKIGNGFDNTLQSNQLTKEELTGQSISTGDKNLDKNLRGIDYDLNNIIK